MLENKIIASVKPNSPAALAGIKEDEYLLYVNGEDFTDIIDLSFLFAEEYLQLTILSKDKVERIVPIEKELDEEVGLEFNTAIFDKVKECYNNCMFCFVDQMAPNMRDSLYIKDDDYRLSFLYGNFITLTNITDEGKERIKKLNLSPLYVSIHATDVDVRKKMIRNVNAGKVLEHMKDLASFGIKFHTQIVLCPTINDGEVLEKTYNDLVALKDSVLSMAVVPVGITKFRKIDDEIRLFTKEEARAVVEKVSQWQGECRKYLGRSFVYPSDEFYVASGMDFPSAEYYDGFAQYENGIGICRKFIDQWYEEKIESFSSKEDVYIVCGKSAENVLHDLIGQLEKETNNRYNVLAIENEFFGKTVTVTGLLTGQDIVNAVLKLAKKPKTLIIPGITLRKDTTMFLDNFSLEQLENAVACKVRVAEDAAELKHTLA